MTKVGVVCSGWSDEKEVSKNSANNIAKWLRIKGHDVDVLDITVETNLSKLGEYELIYNTIHGPPGEDGTLQGYMDMIGVKHTSSSILASSLTYNKFMTNKLLNGFGIVTSPAILLKKNQVVTPKQLLAVVGYPCFVKPNLGGSSLGASKVDHLDQLTGAIRKAREHCDEVVIERFIEGREVTCGILNRDVLAITEILHKGSFFDHEAKYSGATEEVTPAKLESYVESTITRITKKIYDVLDLKGFARMDYIINKTDEVYLLEVNTNPGMSSNSIIPKQVESIGWKMEDVLDELVKSYD